MSEKEEGSLIAAADEFAAIDHRYSKTIFSYFTINERSAAVFSGMHDAFMAQKAVGLHPYGLGIGRTGGEMVPIMDVIMHGGKPQIIARVEMREFLMPEGMYLIAFAPCIVTPGNTNEGVARNAIAFAIGLVVAMLGRAAVLHHVVDQTVEAGTLKQTFSGPVMRAPQLADAASLTDGAIVGQALNAMQSLPENQRGPMAYACSLFGRAAQEADETFRFALYWIALEVIAGAKGKGVPARLGNAYGEGAVWVLKELQFQAIYDLRHEVVHQGEQVSLDARMERIMQGAFLDLWRWRLKLACKGVVKGVLQHLKTLDGAHPPGFDIQHFSRRNK